MDSSTRMTTDDRAERVPLPPPPAHPSLRAMFVAFGKLGITSFGGGGSGLMHAEFVTRLAWVSEEEFLDGLAVSQALPGVNVANLSIWLGYRCRGAAGAIVGITAVILPPAVAIVLIGTLLLRASSSPLVATFLAGVAAAAMGMSLSVGYLAARHASGDRISIAILAATIFGAAVLHLSALVLVAVLAPIGIGLAFRHDRHER